MAEWIISKHATEQMIIRGIPLSLVKDILAKAQSVLLEQGKKIYQSIVNFGEGDYMVRVFVNIIKEPNVVITVYKTSKTNKYNEG